MRSERKQQRSRGDHNLSVSECDGPNRRNTCGHVAMSQGCDVRHRIVQFANNFVIFCVARLFNLWQLVSGIASHRDMAVHVADSLVRHL
jgi:hypothetical protein